MKTLYPIVGLVPDASTMEVLFQVERVLFESVQNCYDHAAKAPLSQETRIHSHLSLRYYRKIPKPRALTADFLRYLETLDSSSSSPLPPSFVEVVIADDGVGLASRHALNSRVYQGSLDEETDLFALVFKAGESVKARAHDSVVRGQPGYGFSRIAGALRALRAFALIRSGRCQATLSPFDDHHEIAIRGGLGWLPGTVLQVVVPLFDPDVLPFHE